MKNFRSGCALVALMISAAVAAEDSYSPYAGKSYPQNVYFGDTHLHTNISVDANGMGNQLLSPDEAYRFARGEVITAHNGQKAKLGKPLDFLVAADHAYQMGIMPRLEADDPVLQKTELGSRWYKAMKEHPTNIGEILHSKTYEDYQEMFASAFDREGERSYYWDRSVDFRNEGIKRSVWAQVTSKADVYNEPGKFTAFTGYEWTSSGHQHGNLHRVVIFKDGMEKTAQILPFDRRDSKAPEDLWRFMQGYEKDIHGEVLAIAHNGNLSNGEMFGPKTYKGAPIDQGYAEMRSRWEPLYEITQNKGDGEAHPLLSPEDGFADFETWNAWDDAVAGRGLDKPMKEWSAEEKEKKRYEYAREALKAGLQRQTEFGVNPFKIGFIGSTDAHTSMAAVEENNYWGKLTFFEPSPYRARMASHMSASGYAAVWAEENTRESIFAAMKRRETYATTGPRMTVRFFGGWGYEQDDANRPDFVKIGYEGGVPMGGDLTSAPKGKAPSFLIRAVKDADGANLDRVQVIKGWRDKKGKLHEKVYNVALSDGRKDKGKKTKLVGSTVDVADASYTNTIGETELATVWRDPDFKASELAFYYVRVLEIPTPRWPAYDAKYYGLTDLPETTKMVIQERAYTSPIWYTP